MMRKSERQANDGEEREKLASDGEEQETGK
jgi:hypothetical protein